MNGENLYYLMHRNDIVTIVEIDCISGSITKINSKVQKELLPLGGNLSKDDLKRWWERRAVPIGQKNIERILKKLKIPTTQAYLLQNCGLSLSDHYWMKPLDSDFLWEDVNLFSNDFREDIEGFQVERSIQREEQIDLVGKTMFFPSASVQGELQKKWIIRDGKRCLVKGNYGLSFQQSINEVIATYIHKKLEKMPFTEYHLCDIEMNEGSVIGCICENFASIDQEFIPAYDVVSSEKKKNDISQYEHFVKVCVLNGLEEKEVRDFLEYQILTDFLITNTDRHFNNFGILRDTKTLQFIGMAPIFDSGNSLFWNCPNLPQKSSLLDIKVSSFKQKEIDLLQYVTDAKILDLSKLQDVSQIAELLGKNIDFEQKIEGVLLGYQKKFSLLEELQAGKKIWEYNYH